MIQTRSKAITFIFDNSLLLLAGTAAAVVWANLDVATYDGVVALLGQRHGDGVLFRAGSEGSLRGDTAGRLLGVASPCAVAVGSGSRWHGRAGFDLCSFGFNSWPDELIRGWAIPCAADIAFSAMVARAIFPSAHPAIPFLLLLAIADDALGLVILAVFYPSGALSPMALTGS